MNEHLPYRPKRAVEASPGEGPVEELSEEARTLDAIAEALGTQPQAFAAWAEFHDADPDMLARINQHFLDHLDSLDALGQSLVGNARERLAVLGPLAPYVSIDYSALAEDQLRNAGCIALPAPDGGFYLFRGPDGDAPALDTS